VPARTCRLRPGRFFVGSLRRHTASHAFAGYVVQPDPETFDSVNPRFNLSYLPTRNSNYYFNIARGFRSGTFNNRCQVRRFRRFCLEMIVRC